MVKHYLTERGVRFELRDVNSDPAAQADFLRRGFLLPPVTLIGDKAIAGFQPDRFEELLGEL